MSAEHHGSALWFFFGLVIANIGLLLIAVWVIGTGVALGVAMARRRP